jgi:hypothetical protein
MVLLLCLLWLYSTQLKIGWQLEQPVESCASGCEEKIQGLEYHSQDSEKRSQVRKETYAFQVKSLEGL